MFNNGNNGGGNPNHDENGRFTSGANKASGNNNYEEKVKQTLGIQPEWKKLGYNEDVDEVPSHVSKLINKDGENLTGNINLSKQDVVDFLEDQLSAPLPEKDKQLILEKGMVPKRILNQLNIENLEDALDEYYEGVDDDEWELKY